MPGGSDRIAPPSSRDNWTMNTSRQLDPDTAAFLASFAEGPGLSAGTVTEARANYATETSATADNVTNVTDDRVHSDLDDAAFDIPVRRYANRDGDDLPVVVFFHGGGWVLGGLESHDGFARRLAALTGALVVAVDYRLAPEHPFPAAHDDAWAVTRWLSKSADDWGGDRGRLAVCGDSAGGNLAAGVALRARDEGVDIALQALIYPCIDTELDQYRSSADNSVGYMLTTDDMRWFWGHYVPMRHRANPYAVPARAADLSGVAPAAVVTAEFDPLRDEGEWYAERLARAGVPVTLTRYPGVIHGFVTRAEQIARGREAQREIAASLRSALDIAEPA